MTQHSGAARVRTAASDRHHGTHVEQLLTLDDVCRLTTWSRRSLYRKCSDGSFPKPLKIGRSRIAWKASDLGAWLGSVADAA